MLKPEPMRRILIVGPRQLLEPGIEVLHDLKLVHLQDYMGEDPDLKLGKPLPRASEISEVLVKLRSISKILGLGEVAGIEEVEVPPDAAQRIRSLETNIAEEDGSRKKVEGLLADLGQSIAALEPFAVLGIPLELYRGYRSLDVFVGRVAQDLEGLPNITPRMEAFRADDVVAVFVEKSKGAEVRDFLGQRGFTPLEIPRGEGDPKAKLAELSRERTKWIEKLEEINGRLITLRERYAAFILRAEDKFSEEIEKAEAPLRFATTDHSFVVEGWIPAKRADLGKSRLEALGPLFVSLQEPDLHEEPPVLLQNPKPIQPFETLINVYSTPSYREIDPTLLLSFFLPFFFGFMISDAGFGIVLIILGAWAVRKLKPGAFRDVMYIAFVGGIVATLFGLIVFGEAFGIAFHPPAVAGEAQHITWEDLGVYIPLRPIIEKTATQSVTTILVLTVAFAWVHLSIGYIVGIINEVHHSKRHALAKVGWFMVLLGLFLTILARVAGNPIARFFWTYVFPFPHTGPYAVDFLTSLLGFSFPWVAFVLLLAGTGLAFLESIIAPVEVGGLLANLMSYARLAGFAIGEGIIDATITTLIFNRLILHHDILTAVAGFALLFGSFLLIFPLGALGAGIQALRLNYVEQFLKFYRGNGIPFRPFGVRKTVEA